MGERRLKHWGWGYEDQAPSRRELEEAAAGIRERFGFGGEPEEPVPLDEVKLRAPRLKVPEAFGDLFTDDHYERVAHALGKAYRDVVRGFRGEFENPPDLVAFPRDESEIEVVLSWAEAEGAAVVPFGGGTSVVGGVEARLGERPVVSLDLKRLDRVLEVDAESLAARIQAGAMGPGLEDQLREHGLTLRHFPQSFEYSTLGGWIATRAGGHFATLYTHIDDLVESVRAITPRGTWESRRLPGSGAGPSPDRALIGSEGILGVIAESWVRVRPRPRFKNSCGVEFGDFYAAARAVREISQSGLYPSNCRLLDALEAGTTGAGSGETNLLVLGFESANLPVDEPMRLALDIAQSHGGVPNSPPPGRKPAGEGRGRRRRGIGGRELARGLPARSLPARHLRRLRRAQRDLRDGDHLGPLRAVPRRDDGGGAGEGGRGLRRAGRGAGRPAGQLPLHPRLPRRSGALLHRAGAGGSRRRGRAVGRDQGRGRRGADRGRRHDHPPPRRRPRSPPWYDRQRPAPFAAALRAAKAELDPAGMLNPGVLIDP